MEKKKMINRERHKFFPIGIPFSNSKGAQNYQRPLLYIVDSILIAGTFISLFLIFFSSGSDITGMVVGNDADESNSIDILFSFEDMHTLLIDDNLEFSSPEVYDLEDGLVVDLPGGVHYLMVEGIGINDVRQLDIKSDVRLMVVESGEGYDVINAGEKELDVEIYDQGRFTGKVILTEGGR